MVSQAQFHNQIDWTMIVLLLSFVSVSLEIITSPKGDLGEGNGNPLQYSSLENPVDRGAWWAAVHGVAQSQTRLKQLSRGNSSLQSDLCSNSDSRQCAFIPNYSSHMTRSPSWHYLQPPKHIFVWIT